MYIRMLISRFAALDCPTEAILKATLERVQNFQKGGLNVFIQSTGKSINQSVDLENEYFLMNLGW